MEYEQELASDKECRTPDDSAKAASEDDPDCMSMDNPADLGELTQQLEQGLSANQADDLELCSTTDLLDMFDDYYQEDKKRLESDFLINQTGTHFDHQALSNSARSSAAAPVRAELGSYNAECDVESLIVAE